MLSTPSSCRRFGVALALAPLLAAFPSCEPKLVIGEYGVTCDAADAADGAGGDGSGGEGQSMRSTDPLPTTWSTGFETGFCDYASARGFCYKAPRAGYDTVTSPVHSGEHAAAYRLATDSGLNGNQSRCVLAGRLPDDAGYGAYFFIPEAPTAASNWNLIHFRGLDGARSHGLWDVSINVQRDGSLRLFVFDHLRMLMRNATSVPAVPIGAWFKLEVRLKRAANDSGTFTLYQDDQLALELSELITDDTSVGEWYLGNLAGALTPSESTLYVDDVFLRPWQ